MKVKKISLFYAVNIFMVVFCIGAMCANHTVLNFLNMEEAKCSIGNDIFEYKATENAFSVHKNGNLVGTMPTNKKMQFKSTKSFLQPHACVVAGKVISAGFDSYEKNGKNFPAFKKGAKAELEANIARIRDFVKKNPDRVTDGVKTIAESEVGQQVGTAVVATAGTAGEAVTAAGTALVEGATIAESMAVLEATFAAGSGVAALTTALIPLLIAVGIGGYIA